MIVSRSAPDPSHGSGMHMEDFVGALRSAACEVHYLALCPPRNPDPARSAVDVTYFLEAGEYVPTTFDQPALDGERRTVHQICRQIAPSVVIADYSWMAGIYDAGYFAENTSVRKLVFVHDLRVRILPSYVTMGLMKSEDNGWTDEREGAMLAKADALLTLNDEDQRVAAALAPNTRVLKMGMSVSPQYVDQAAAVPGRCIYVASGAGENLFAVMWLLKYVWPQVVAACGSASLVICGSVCDQLKAAATAGNDWLLGLENQNVFIEGRKDDLRPYYATAEIAVIPHWMMGGIKIKHIEAIAHGLAVVCTPAGADGLPESVGRSALVGEMPEEFAAHLIRLMSDRNALEQARKNSRDLSLQLAPAVVYREVVEYLRET